MKKGIEDIMFDWNTLSLDQMVEYLRKKYMFLSSGDAKCIIELIDFYDKYKHMDNQQDYEGLREEVGGFYIYEV